jgi:hypothetical protein
MRNPKNKQIYKGLRAENQRSVVMNLRLFTGVSAVFALTSGIAVAHHGWGSYDASKLMTVNSTVARLAWQNPHVHIDVNQDGATWEVVLAPPFRMQARGLSPEMIKEGSHVRAEGYRSTRVEHELRAERITVGGKTFELR